VEAHPRLAPDKVHLDNAVRPLVLLRPNPLTLEEMEAVAAFLWTGAEMIASCSRATLAGQLLATLIYWRCSSACPWPQKDLAQAFGTAVALCTGECQQRLGIQASFCATITRTRMFTAT